MDHFGIQLLSDLHLESPTAYDVFEVIPSAPHLALLGDIGYVTHDGLFDFLQAQLSKFETVFYLLGNHEAYHSSYAFAKKKLKDFEHSMNQKRDTGKHGGRFVFLDQTRYDLSDRVTILGCTLHSRVTLAQEERVSFGLNDFYHIRDWSVSQHNDAHAADLAWLNEQVERLSRDEPQRKVLIFTHHCPTLDARTTAPEHASSPIRSGFATDLSREQCWTSKAVAVWAFGHTHFNCDFQDGGNGKCVVANQRGYYFQQAKGFEPTKVL